MKKIPAQASSVSVTLPSLPLSDWFVHRIYLIYFFGMCHHLYAATVNLHLLVQSDIPLTNGVQNLEFNDISGCIFQRTSSLYRLQFEDIERSNDRGSAAVVVGHHGNLADTGRQNKSLP